MDIKEAFQKLGEQMERGEVDPFLLPSVFWSWNEDLQLKELSRQIREMKRAGLGGYFMHSRIGLIPSLLSEEWIRCIQAAIQSGKEEGLKAWLYDEDCWPIDSARDSMLQRGPEYLQKWLEVKIWSPHEYQLQKRTLATFIGVPKGRSWENLRRVPVEQASQFVRSPEEKILEFSWEASQYVDLLNPKTVRVFLEESYKAHIPVCGEEFGQAVPGVFMDEPQWQAIPWSSALAEAFARSTGQDLLDLLPALFYDLEKAPKVRFDFWKTATQQFVESFSRQIGEWCEQHHLILTGQMMSENSLSAQIEAVGAVMPHYEYFQMPGIGHLGRRLSAPVVPKQVASVGRQLGKRVLSKTFGGSGWNVTLENLKLIAEWQLALGINFFCPHLSLYSLRGCRKRDHPPSLHYQMPWWPEYTALNRRIAREIFLLTQGKPVTDILLLHPITSAWVLHNPWDSSEVQSLHQDFVELSSLLLSLHRDYDYGDELLIAKYAKVEKNKILLGQQTYSLLLLPPIVNLCSSTVNLIEEFLKQGGKVVAVFQEGKPIVRFVSGEENAQAKAISALLAEKATLVPLEENRLDHALFTTMLPRVQIKDEEGAHASSILYQERELEGGKRLFFFVNTDQEREIPTTVALMATGTVEEWDPDTGQITEIPSREIRGISTFNLSFSPAGSKVIIVDSQRPHTPKPNRRKTNVGLFYLEDQWHLRRLGPNALTLDYARFSVNGGPWSEPRYLLHLQKELSTLDRSAGVSLEFSIKSRIPHPPQDLYLVLEEPWAYKIEWNNTEIPYRDEGWWVDISFRKIPLAGLLKPGENLLRLTRRFPGRAERDKITKDSSLPQKERHRLCYGVELEAVYLIGDFDVRSEKPFTLLKTGCFGTDGPFVLTPPAEEAYTGDLSQQGLPFFAGSVALEQNVEIPERPFGEVRVFLEFEKIFASVCRVSVNGQEVGKLYWRPWRIEITPFIRDGETHRIQIELTSGLRNLLGPHHHLAGEPTLVGPDSFLGRKSWTDPQDAPENTFTDRYAFVAFGLEGTPAILYEIHEIPQERKLRDEELRRWKF